MPDAAGQTTAQYFKRCIQRWSDPRWFVLDARFVSLTLMLDQGEEAQGPRWQAGSERFQNLREVLDKTPEQALVLLGPLGSGKSTLLRHFELECARSALENATAQELEVAPLTFLIQLSEYKPARPSELLPLPSDWLTQRWAQQNPDLPGLEPLLRDGRMTLLLDALNEIPYAGTEPVRLWKDFLRELADIGSTSRVVFSCRSLDYSASLSSKELPVPQVRIEPLSDEQVKQFVENYSPEYGQKLWEQIEGSPQLDLFRSPYYLKMLVDQAAEGELPGGRAALFTGFVRQLLRREVAGDNPLFQAGELLHERDTRRLIHARRWKTPFELPERGILIPKLSQLAYGMQKQRSANEAGQVRVDYDDALDLEDASAVDILNAGVALDVLEHDLERDEVLYLHQLLQEYFAARTLARNPEPDLVHQEWRAARVAPDLEETLASLPDSDPLPPLPGTGWEETAVLAAAMAEDPDSFVADLMEANLALAGRCTAQPDAAVSASLADKLRWALVNRTNDPKADLRARIAAGLALGDLGDLRFELGRGPDGDYLLPPMIEVPEGRYSIGSEGYEREAPVHEVPIKWFSLGKFPVTNAEWRLFMDAGGYEDARWWQTEEAEVWRSGESTAEGPKKQQRENRGWCQDNFDQIRELCRQERMISEEAKRWEQVARMSDEAFEALLGEWYPSGRQTEPDYWNDDAFNNPEQPVVGIGWHEANAYCAWLSVQTGRSFRFPTEAEWEAAARGFDGRRYAYGDAFDADRCNTFESHIRRTTPIAVFPGGEPWEELVDMTGNVWEWTGSLYRPYPYDADDGRESLVSGDGRRVVRGGAWFDGQDFARAAYRDYFHPEFWLNYLGFRLLCSSPIP